MILLMLNTISPDYKRHCQYCSKTFTLNPRLGLKWAKKKCKGRYCSTKCAGLARRGKRPSINTEFTSERIGWDKHPRFKDGLWSYQKFRKSECEDCESTKNLDVHHLDHNRRNNNLNNLKTLCHKCHISNYHTRKAWNKGLKLPLLSREHKLKISAGVKKHYA